MLQTVFTKVKSILSAIYAKLTRAGQWLMKQYHTRRWLRVISWVFVIVIIFHVAVGSWYAIRHRNDPHILGVSISTKAAADYGYDYREMFVATLDDLGFKHLRLMSYWDEIQPTEDEFDYELLDWQMDTAASRDATVSLAIGERQPRWPECHVPIWADTLDQQAYEDALLRFISVTVDRYKDHPALGSYQLENEYANNLFGECHGATQERLQREVELVKFIDDEHPLIINTSNQSGFPVQEPVGDRVGLSMYRKAYPQTPFFDFYWSFWYVPPLWHSYRSGMIELLHGSEVFVHELQTEPWGPEATVNLSEAEQARSFQVEDMRKNVEYARASGNKEVYMWGVEWWYWRQQTGSPEYWNEAKMLVEETNQQN